MRQTLVWKFGTNVLGIDPCYTRVLAEIDSPEKCAFQLSVAGNWGGVCSAGERHVYSSGAQEITVLEIKLFTVCRRLTEEGMTMKTTMLAI